MNAGNAWLIDSVQLSRNCFANGSSCEPHVKSHLPKTRTSVKVRNKRMPVHRKRFRIEEAFGTDMPAPEVVGGEIGPMHREIMAELRAIRAQMGSSPGHKGGNGQMGETGKSAAAAALEETALREVAEARALLDTYRAHIEQCEKLKVELDLIHDAINRTKREIAVLHGSSFNGEEMAKVNGELGAVVGGTEQATQQILEAAESIDQAASALSKVNSFFEACNFQDLTGQRISKVMTTMKFIENHINVMMDIWGGVDAIKAHVPAIVDTREGADKLLNGPKLDGDVGHASQDDIDALFD